MFRADDRPALAVEHLLVESVAPCSLVFLEQAQFAEALRASQDGIVGAGDRERQRIERDLHDGAQGRLIAIQMKLSVLRDRVGLGAGAGITAPDVQARLAEISGDVDDAIEELRGLAHGLYPAALREGCLADALYALPQAWAIPMTIAAEDVRECGPAVAAAVYFCVLEAIQNAAKHAGPDARVVVTVERRGWLVVFEVVDDGVGFDVAATIAGMGLISLRDRLGAVGGNLAISSVPGRGTTIRGFAPDAQCVSTDRKSVSC